MVEKTEVFVIKPVEIAIGLLCLTGSTLLAQPQNQRLDQQHAQFRKKQLDLQNRRRAQQQQQLNQERLRAEHGWQLHPRPEATWEERQREYQLKQEFQRGQ